MRPVFPVLTPLYDALSEPAYALTRFVAGAFLIPHGMWKLFGITGSREQMIEFFASIGLVPAVPIMVAVGLVEFVGGILIAIGFVTRPAAAAATITTGTAALYFHLPLGFYVDEGGAEFALLWTVVLLMIAVRGAGNISVDAWLGREV